MSEQLDATLEHWWGDLEPAEGEINYLKIGPSEFWLTRYPQEWRVAHWQSIDFASSDLMLLKDVSAEGIHPEATVNQFSFRTAPKTISFVPLLANRPIVVKPEHPFSIQQGEEVTLYVTTAAWLSLKFATTKLQDYPLFRPSDTWFGSSTIEGELCYASRIKGRLRLEDVTPLPHRAITPLRIENKAKEALMLDKVKLPIMYLALYEANSSLWTQSVTLIKEESGDLAALRLGRAAPREVRNAKRLAEPRQKASKNLVIRAFSKLFSNISS
jgi:hypothetical protein